MTVAPSFHVEVLEPGRKVKVGPDFSGNDAADALAYAVVLIEEGGWRQGDRGSNSLADLSTKEGGPGYSLHDAIGAACEALSGIVPEASSSKDWRTKDPLSGEWHEVREEATAAVVATIKKRSGRLRKPIDDRIYNDEKAKSPADVIAVLNEARREVLKDA